MVPRKKRIPVVVDTNVFVRAFKARSKANWNHRVIRLWLVEKKLQLIVSADLIDEYLGIFADVLTMEDETVADWRMRFEKDGRSTVVNLGRRYTESRDPDDNVLLATATAGRASFLISNDRDLLELSGEFQRQLSFEILTPQAFGRAWNED